MNSRPRFKISGRAIVVIIVVLALITAVAAYMNMSGNDSDADGYSLTVAVSDDNGDIKDLKTYTLAQIENMPSVNVYTKLQSSEKGDEEGTFTGVTVKYLLNKTDPDIIKEHENFIFSAGDGYSSAASADEVRGGKSVIIAYAKDGKDMEHFNEGGSGPMRVVFTRDTYGNRSTKFLIKIICK